jgi:hypothetical protein
VRWSLEERRSEGEIDEVDVVVPPGRWFLDVFDLLPRDQVTLKWVIFRDFLFDIFYFN